MSDDILFDGLEIKIGPITYKVKEIAGLRAHDGTFLLGELNPGTATISLDPNGDERATLVTLMHEVCHGLLIHAGYTHDESLVECLSYQLTALMLDNPGFLLWVMGFSMKVDTYNQLLAVVSPEENTGDDE